MTDPRRQYQQFPVEQPPPFPDHPHAAYAASLPAFPAAPSPAFPAPQATRSAPMSFPTGAPGRQNMPPPSGYRIPLQPGQPIPHDVVGQPPFRDLDGSPVFIGSALMQNPDCVHPCKIAPHLDPHARVAYGGGEHEHRGRYDLLPFHPEQMEWVRTGHGRIPQGRRPVEGGYEQNGAQLYHAYAHIDGVDVPGKTGEHLGGANIPFGGGEHVVNDGYHILVWRH